MPPDTLQLLVVEDNPADAELILRALRKAGFDPEWRRVDSEAGFLAALHPGLDLILSDYEMPQFTGLSALHLLQARGLDIPFIIISGTIGEDTAVEAMRQGAVDYLLKDRLVRLGPAVAQALAQGRLRREARTAEAQRDRLVAILEATTDLVSSAAPTGQLLFLNRAGRKLLGVAPDADITKCVIADFIPNPAQHPDMREGIPAAIRDGTWQGEVMLLDGKGQEFPVDQVILAHKAADGSLEFLSTIMRDIRTRKKSESLIRDQLAELLRWQQVMLDREDRVQALKAEVNALLASQNQTPRYGGAAPP